MRMIVMMVISLYTSRVVLQTLGVDNYGIYNVVGGIIVFFTFINNGLSSATKRYITADIADNDIEKGKHTFNITLQAHLIIAALILVLAELIGPYVIYKFLNIPEGREIAAQIVYQISVFTAILSVIQSPFSTVIVAYEKMDVYAYFTIIDVILKLGVVFLVQYIQGDKLIIYASLIMCVIIVNILYFGIYSLKKFPICKFIKVSDKPLLKSILGFAGWNVFGQSASLLTNQGVSILVNIFCGVAVNAAMGISNAITQIVTQFVSNFQVAFNPQIIKSYNLKEYSYLHSLVVRSAKITSYLIIFFLVPLLFVADKVLTLWLGYYPEYSVEFCLSTLFCIYIDSISAPIYMVIYSQTNIKKYQLIISSVYSLCFFLGWIGLLLKYPPYCVIIARFAVFIVLLIIRLRFLKKLMYEFDLKDWVLQVPLKSFLIFMIAICLTGLFHYLAPFKGFIDIAAVSIVSFVVNAFLMISIGFSQSERNFVLGIIRKRIHR